MRNFSCDVIIVGSGVSSLVCAAELALKGRHVIVLEREEVIGGCMRTEELTLPGFRHDVFSMSLPLFTTAAHYPSLSPELAKHGFEVVLPTRPTGVMTADGRALVLSQSREENIAAFEALAPGDGEAFARAMADITQNSELLFGLLGGEPATASTLRLLVHQLLRRKPAGLAAFAGDALEPMRNWLQREFRSDLVQALFAPWILHTGLSPESALSALMGKLILFTLEGAGNPFVKGGVGNLVSAFRALIESRGSKIITNTDISEVVVERGAATAVRTSDGRAYTARRAIVCNVTPTQLYGRLLPSDAAPAATAAMAKAYAYGLGDMQIHIALSEPPQWADERLADVGLVHVTPGLDGVSRAINEAQRGLLPAEGTIVVGQPAAADPSRCPSGKSLLWIQLQELPRVIRGDAAGLLQTPPDGRWSEEIRDAYAARIVARLGSHIRNLRSATLSVAALSPADLERANINLVGGDPYSGACSIDQFHLFRPFASLRNHGTPIKRLFHIGASTHPGPGLSGMSGHMAAACI